MGARFRLKAGYDISRFSAQGQVILRALQHYGLILADNGSNWFFSGTQDAGWPDSLISELKTVPAFHVRGRRRILPDARPELSGRCRSCRLRQGQHAAVHPTNAARVQ
jgi:hypothetical protein